MKPLDSKIDPYREVRLRIASDPKLRQEFYEEGQRMRRERAARAQQEAEYEATKEERMRALYERLGLPRPKPEPDPRFKMPAAEAFIVETWPDVANSETAPTMEAFRRLSQFEFYRLKAARRILKELGIR